MRFRGREGRKEGRSRVQPTVASAWPPRRRTRQKGRRTLLRGRGLRVGGEDEVPVLFGLVPFQLSLKVRRFLSTASRWRLDVLLPGVIFGVRCLSDTLPDDDSGTRHSGRRLDQEVVLSLSYTPTPFFSSSQRNHVPCLCRKLRDGCARAWNSDLISSFRPSFSRPGLASFASSLSKTEKFTTESL